VAPLFLKNPERIAGLLCILVWALMERHVRREVKGQVYPENRPSPAPTGPALMESSSGLCIVIVRQGDTVTRGLSQPDPAQRRILHLLGIKWERLQTFKRRCGM
jgi:hypothetical protein